MASSVVMAVFVDTNLGTRMAVDVSPDITARDLKRELETEHFNCFWRSGEIRISGLMVKRKSCLYHLPDSMPIRSAFRGVNGTWFLHVEARLLSDCNGSGDGLSLHKYVASKVGDHVSKVRSIISHPLNPENFVTSSTAKTDDQPSLQSSSEVVSVSVSGIIHRYFSNLSEDDGGGPASPTRSVTSRALNSRPEEHLKTRADDICSNMQVRPLPQFSAKRPPRLLCLPSPTDIGQRRYKLNEPQVGKRIVVASYSLGITHSKEHPAIYLRSFRNEKTF